ncbi:hypothetical protein MHU86_4138 [Fragilaria crotonensis]|nr:hypothetical protein MHU86_4138 [Fragilaria crotonensis]
MISSYKLSKAHSSSLPLLEFVRDVGDAFKERPEVPLRIVSILADLNSPEIASEILQEIVKMLHGYNNLIERCSILIEGKIQALTNDDGSMQVVCSTGNDGEPQTLWISSDVNAAADAAVGSGKRRRGRLPKKSSPAPKKDVANPSQDVERAVRLKRKRRVRHRKNPQPAPQQPPKEPEGGDAVMTDVNPPQPPDRSSEQPVDARDETIVRRRGKGPPRQHPPTPPPPTGEVDEEPTPVKRGRRGPRNKKPLGDSETPSVTEKRTRAPRPFFRGRGRQRNNKSASITAAEVAPDSAPL